MRATSPERNTTSGLAPVTEVPRPMPPASPPYLNTVANLRGCDRNGRRRWVGTGFFCHTGHWFDAKRKVLFLVTNAHVVDNDFKQLEVLFPPIGGGLLMSFSVTAEIGTTTDTWNLNRKEDLAVLRLDGEHLPEREIRRRSFDVYHGALAVRDLRWLRVEQGDEAFMVGWVLPQECGNRQFPGLRLATISGLPRRVKPGRWITLDGVVLGGNSGSPVVLRRDPIAGSGAGSGAAGKLIGVVCRTWNWAKVIQADETASPSKPAKTSDDSRSFPWTSCGCWSPRLQSMSGSPRRSNRSSGDGGAG